MLFLLMVTTIKPSVFATSQINECESLDSGHKAKTFFESCKREIKDKITKNEKQ